MESAHLQEEFSARAICAVVGQTAAVICDARKPSRRVWPDTKVFLHMVAAHASTGNNREVQQRRFYSWGYDSTKYMAVLLNRRRVWGSGRCPIFRTSKDVEPGTPPPQRRNTPYGVGRIASHGAAMPRRPTPWRGTGRSRRRNAPPGGPRRGDRDGRRGPPRGGHGGGPRQL